MKLEINHDWGPYKKGQIINTPDVDGVSTDIYWRRRLADAEIDNCVSIVKQKAKAKAKAVTKTSGEDK